jgi:hypothetical protein
MATVESLDVAQRIVEEDLEGVVAVYEYRSVYCPDKKLYSVEFWTNRGATVRSGYTINPQLIYTKEAGWSDGYAPKSP